jgi:hypothetical protein
MTALPVKGYGDCRMTPPGAVSSRFASNVNHGVFRGPAGGAAYPLKAIEASNQLWHTTHFREERLTP